MIENLKFSEFSSVNRARGKTWHSRGYKPWTGADWSNAMCGEAGEAANVVKKLRRIESNTWLDEHAPAKHDALVKHLADEIGDVVAYLDLLANHYGLSLAECVRNKFNAVSEREGLTEFVL